MTSNEIRKQFLDFFESKKHKIVESAPVVPFDDPTLLFINAGMNQFKDVFLGTGKRDYTRAADTQKCIRVSGKHNDLEEVGRDTYHHTFFEMLGNWSFGDYYKKEAIEWAWELLTEVWKLPKERLWATVFRTDDEAYELWKSQTDIDPKHILRFDEKDNFWEMGDTGPCGPCSEIHINLSDDLENGDLVNAGVPECIEIWNLVFIQYNRDAEGTLHDLPSKHVDTGMGFERICAVLQGKDSNYGIDIFEALIQKISELSKSKFDKEDDKIAMRVIADHVRALSFAIADGAVPSNEGRGYVLRRILRRAARYGRKLNLNEPFLFKIVETLVEKMSDTFPELKENQKNIERIIKGEEESFNATLDKGLILFNQIVASTLVANFNDRTKYEAELGYETDSGVLEIKILLETEKDRQWSIDQKKNVSSEFYNKDFIPKSVYEKKIVRDWHPIDTSKYFKEAPSISGHDVFKLYDTFGFPVDLTNVMAEEKGLSIDEKMFNELMSEQKDRARKSTKDKTGTVSVKVETLDDFNLESNETTEFTGYNELSTTAKILGWKNEEDNLLVVLDRSPFYVEAGGQISDTGKMIIDDQEFEIVDVTKIDDQIIHVLDIDEEIELSMGNTAEVSVDKKRRWNIMRNHSVTHFLHAVLRNVLGSHVQQAGSYVGPDRLRFDFTHFEKVSAEQLKEIEKIVNEKLRENLALNHHKNIPFEEAKKMGAMMFFGDKYGDRVNVVQFGDFTLEFCGGTHVQNSSQIGLFKIVSESSIASGVRRIEAVTGEGVQKFIEEQESRIQNSENRIKELHDEKRKLEKELAELHLQEKLGGIENVISNPTELNGINVFKGKVEAANMDELKSMGDELREKMKSGVGMLISEVNEKVGIVVVVSDDLIKDKKLLAGKIVGNAAKLVGGGGGGRPHLATAGGKDISKIDSAIEEFDSIVSSFL